VTSTAFVSYHVDDSHLEALMVRLQSALSPIGMQALLRGPVKEHLQKRIAQRFASEGDDMTGPWEPLKDATVALRESQGFPGDHPINFRTGEMYEYLTSGPEDFTGSTTVSVLTMPGDAGSTEVREKVRTAQQGLAYPNTVPRPVLGLDEEDAAVILSMAALHLATYPAAMVAV